MMSITSLAGLCVEICPIKYKAIAIKASFSPDRGEERLE